MPKLIGIGECLIDFLPKQKNTYEMKPGGAPTNVCACVSKLGGDAYFLGKLSTDFFGKFLLENVKKYGVQTNFVSYTQRPTSLAFVNLDKKGDRSFSFYRNDNADLLLGEEDIKQNFFEKDDILHMCSVGLVESPSKYAHKKAIKLAKQEGAKVCFDVNLRIMLYESEQILRKTVKEFLPFANLLKVSDDELEFIFEEKDELKAIKQLFDISKEAEYIFLTKGEKGACVYDRTLKKIERPARVVKAVDTTGAGDSFIGSVIYKFLKNKNLEMKEMKDVLDFAIATSSLVVQQKGAMNAMPELEKVNNILKGDKI